MHRNETETDQGPIAHAILMGAVAGGLRIEARKDAEIAANLLRCARRYSQRAADILEEV